MLHTNTAHESNLRPTRLMSPPVQMSIGEAVAIRYEEQTEVAIDDALAASFPASDPPGWNPGLARPGPLESAPAQAVRLP
jgi:hypothetical protein